MDHTARERTPEASARQASDSKSEAARAKAEEGHRDGRMHDGSTSLRVGSVSGMKKVGWYDEQPHEAKSKDTLTARDIWCLWARLELEGRPHQRALPCDRCACGLRGRHTAGTAHESKHNAA
eukprot:6179332-Pleurochrysis_carterae.AAC.2